MLSRCLCSTARAFRPAGAAPLVAYRPAPPSRPLHSSAPLFKKVKGARPEEPEEFEEFAEDEFDEGIEELRPEDAPPSVGGGAGRADAGLSQEIRYAQRLPVINEALGASHFKFRSTLPSYRSVITLLNLTTPETVDSSLAVLAKWRARGLPPLAADALVKKLVKFRGPQKVIDLLQDRTTYGVELKDVRGLDILYADLSKIGAAEREDPSLVRSALDQAHQLNDIVKFYVTDIDPVGPLMTLAPALLLANSPSAAAEDKSAAKALLAEATLFAPEEVETVVLDEVRSSKVKRLIASRVVTIREELEKLGGEEKGLRWIQQVEKSLEPYMRAQKE